MRFGIGAKLGVLASVLIVATGVTLAWWTARWSRQALQRQGRADLETATRLHGQELLTDLHALRAEAVRQAARPELQDLLRAGPAEQAALERRVQEGFRKALQDTPHFLQIELLLADPGARAPPRATRDAARVRGDGALDRHFPGLRSTRGDNQGWLSAIHQDDVLLAGRPVPVCRAAAPVFLAAGGGTPRYAGAVVLTADFSPIARQLRRSPRLLTFLTDDRGRFLVHPQADHELSPDAPPISSLLPRLAPLYEAGAEPSFRYPEEKGPWPSPEPYYLLTLSIKDPAAWQRPAVRTAVQQALDALTPGEDGLASEAGAEVQLRGRDRDRLQREGQALAEQFPSLLKLDATREWRTFAVQFLRVEYSRGGGGPPRWLGLVQAVSSEELDEPVSTWHHKKYLWLQLGLLIAAGSLLAVFLARRLTWPLHRITRATRDLARGNFDVTLPVEANDEIGVLARCFKDMAEQMQQNVHEKREEEARLKAVLRTAAEGIFILDDDGRIQMLNQAAQRIFGYSDRELEGQNVKVLIPREVQGLPVEGQSGSPSATESLRLGKINNRTHEVIGRRKDGTTFPLELSVSDAPVGSRRVYTGIVRDVTERKKAEKEIRDLNEHLQRLNEQLDRRVQERTRQLSRSNEELAVARDQALEASRIKSVFLGQMSHEFRTPLNHIKGYAELLREELQERGLNDLTADLDRVLEASRNLLYLVSDVLDLSAIEARRLDLSLEAFDVRAMLDDLACQLGPRVLANGNELNLDFPATLGLMYADSKRVRQVLGNLLSNAAKFTHDGRVEVEVRRESERGRDWIVFRVRDSGIGIAAEQLGKLFRPFSQVDDALSRKYDGSGLGLVISRSFCQMMGGDISVESEAGKGSTFTVRLPAQVTDGVPDAPGTVLLIGGDGAAEGLAREGVRAVLAGNGLEGLRLARRLTPAAIALDADLPGLTGWDVLAALKADPATARVPVVMLTSADDRGTALALGAADQLSKPVDRVRLAAALGQYRAGLARGA